MSAIFTDLYKKHVLITGGASGIGAALCRAFAKQKCRVTFLDKDLERSRSVISECLKWTPDVKFYGVDLKDTEALLEKISCIKKELPTVDILIPNAGYDPRYFGLNMSKQEWNDLFELNVTHYFIICREFIPKMIEAGGGVIIMTTSHTVWVAKPDLIAYNATKSSIIGMVRSIAEAYGKNNIRINAVAPGWIMTERQTTEWVTPQEKENTIHNCQAMPILLTPEGICDIFLFLASNSSRYLTRQVLVADAGQSKH